MIAIGKPRISNGVLYLDEAEFAKCEIRDGIYYYGRKEPFLRGLTKRDFYDPEEHNIQIVFDSIENEEYTFVLVEDEQAEFPLSQQEIDWIQAKWKTIQEICDNKVDEIHQYYNYMKGKIGS